jgi:hypothetical protein
MSIQEEINKAKEVLKTNGYYIDNLWSTPDVMQNYNCTIEEAQEVLDQALTNEATMEQVWFAINFHAEENNLESIN